MRVSAHRQTLQAEIEGYIDQLLALERQALNEQVVGLCEQVVTCSLAISRLGNEAPSEFRELLAYLHDRCEVLRVSLLN